MPSPRWYLPPGVDEPPHVRHERVRLRALPDAPAPCGLAPGGVYIGGAIGEGDDAARWQRHSGGWAYEHSAADPLACARATVAPFARWRTIPAPNGGRWRVPVVVRLVRDQGGRVVDIAPAGPRIWRGASWELPAPVKGLAQSLLAFAMRLADGAPIDDEAAVTLALDLLEQGHIFDREEVAGAGWLSDETVALALLTAVGEGPP